MPSTASPILDNLDKLAIVAAGLYTGGSVYISIDEVPAIHRVGTDEHWRLARSIYYRAAISQTVFASAAAVAGITYGTRVFASQNARNLWIFGGATYLGIIVYSIIFVAPTEKAVVQDIKQVKSGNQSKFDLATKQRYIDRWNRLHLVRTVTSLAGFASMILAATHV